MLSLLNISGSSSLAFHAVTFMATHPDRMVSTKYVATSLGISEAHLHKVFQRLVKSGIVKSIRGPKGGFLLKKPLNDIRLLDIFQAIEGPLEPGNCLLESPVCENGNCIFGDMLKTVNNEVMDYLSQTKLSCLAGVFKDSSGGS